MSQYGIKVKSLRPTQVTCTNYNYRTYTIPRYLYNRKIELIKRKILKRKFAYLFYRKTVSKVLPSTAVRHYKRCILRKAFLKLKTYWFEQRIQWRLLLRARLHYKFVLKRRMFGNWKYAVVRRIEKQLQLKIATLHYRCKVKSKCLARLMYASKLNEQEGLLNAAVHKYAIFLFLNLNVISMTCKFYTVTVQYATTLLYEKAFKKRMLGLCFQKCKLFKQRQVVKRNRETLVRLFRKVKYKPEDLRDYFRNWNKFTHEHIKKRCRKAQAEQHFEHKSKYLSFSKLKAYASHRKRTGIQKNIAGHHYFSKVQAKMFKCWQLFLKEKRAKKSKVNAGNCFWERMLKRKYFAQLLRYNNKRRKLKETFVLLSDIYNCRLKRKCFLKTKQYFLANKNKKERYLNALAFCNKQIMSKYFALLLAYTQLSLSKRLAQEHLADGFIKSHNTRLMVKYFTQWKLHQSLVLQKQLKITLAQKMCKKRLLQKAITSWKSFLKCKAAKDIKFNILRTLFTTTIKKITLAKWKAYIREVKIQKTKLHRAKQLYRRYLLRDGIKIILAAAAEKQRTDVKKVERNVLLAVKYYRIWKYKAISKRKLNLNQNTSQSIQNPSLFDTNELFNFKWNPVCFEQPRIPEYLKYAKSE